MSEIITENASQQTSEKTTKPIKLQMSNAIQMHLIAAVIVFLICCFSAVRQMSDSRYVTITINSASVSKGQNPDGSSFDIYQILSDEVLEAAAKKLDNKISVAAMKEHLSVSDALRAETNQQLKQSILDGHYENVYFPAVYHLTYAKTGSETIGQPDTDRILEAVAESYQEYYAAAYLRYDSMFEIDWNSIDAMDYYNRAEALRTEAMRILRFLQDKTNENRAAGSASEKLTYGDLENDLWQLISVDLDSHQAYIIQNNITTSRSTLLRQFRYMEEIYIEEKERKTEEYLILSEAVDMYDSTTTKVVFIPALDQDNSFYMNRTKVGLDYLVENADAARLAADEAEHNAQYYQYLQSCFAAEVSPLRSQINHADAVYRSIRNQVENVVASLQLLLEESNQTANEGIKVGGTATAASVIGIGMSFAKRFVILSMAAYALLYIPTSLLGKKRNKT